MPKADGNLTFLEAALLLSLIALVVGAASGWAIYHFASLEVVARLKALEIVCGK